MHFFLTGHTGFKGAWLSLMLSEAGHSVSGISLDPVEDSLYESAEVRDRLHHDLRGDIREAAIVESALRLARPDVVIHLAAQALVRESYWQPRITVETNVVGTLNVLSGVSQVDSVQAQLLITTDKVYRNVNQTRGYLESDALGGEDLYSASKSMADILIQSWVRNFASPPTAIARAGNVIGGGDVSSDRLLPDLMRSFAAGQPARIRYPDAVRPWQHVLDCLSGYMMLVDYLLEGNPACEAWNFGPDPSAFASVSKVCDIAAHEWGSGAAVTIDDRDHPLEASILTLDSSKARRSLGWSDRLGLQESIAWTVGWTQAIAKGRTPLDITLEQLEMFSST